MQFGILGPLVASTDDGRAIVLPGAKPRALLAALLLHANQPVSGDRLALALWGDDAPPNGTRTVQVHLSRLRRALGDPELLATTPAGYRLRVAPGELDAERFERKLLEGRRELAAGRADDAAALLDDALSLWRGPALAGLERAPFAALEIARLEEQRLTAVELRVEAELTAGRHAELIGELQSLAAEHPWRERLHGQLMLALYRSGRQADALDAYRRAREALVSELGIEPGPELRELHRAILNHDRGLDPGPSGQPATGHPGGPAPAVAAAAPARGEALASILVVPPGDAAAGPLLALAEQLARSAAGEVVVAEIVERQEDLAAATRRLDSHRGALAGGGVPVRATAFTSLSPGEDLVLLGMEQDVRLVLLATPPPLLETGMPDAQLTRVLDRMPCDVALLASRGDAEIDVSVDRPVVVPFGGAEHEWSAVELGAWVAKSYAGRLKLVGTRADPLRGRRDASRLLARAALMVQRVAAVPTEPELVAPGPEGVLPALASAGLAVVGFSSRWREEGLGETRRTVLRDGRPPCALVGRGVESGAVTPRETFTRFTWTLGAAG